MSLKIVLLPFIFETFIMTVAAQINLAPQGVAVQLTTHTVFNASLAIEGPANNKWIDGCSATAANQNYAWWGLQLPTVAHMTTILIYYRGTSAHRMAGFRLYLENGTADESSTLGECYSDVGKDGPPSTTQNIDCNMLAKNMYFVNNRTIVDCFVELCYVAIYGCWKATWGTNCRESCPVNCINQNCYPETGLCVWGCNPQNCSNNKCDIQTGVCTDGCIIGQDGQYCNMPCDPGYFGNNCSRKCSENCFDPPCHHVTGYCTGGCKKGWEEFNCTKECDLGYFGLNCSKSCPGCVSNDCDNTDGSCNSGCEPGYAKGPYCDQECGDWYFGINCARKCNCLKEVCKKDNGECSVKGCEEGWHGFACDKECDNGFYGFNCKEQCATCFNMSCERFEGNCSYGCIDRYKGVKCQNLVNGDLNISDINSSASIGGSIGAAVVIIVIVVILIILNRRRSRARRENNIINLDKIDRRHENSYCNHKIALTTEDVYLNVNSVQDSAMAKPSLAGKKEITKRRIEVIDEYPEEHDEEKEGKVYYNILPEPTITRHKIPIADLKKVIIEKRKEDDFKNEYELLPKGLVHAHTEGSKEENKVKNRFLTTWPYDHSRVVLTGDTKHDYINASYIDSYNRERAYIASQGPKKNTIKDFWQMVWQEKVSKIVMVTKLEEERRKKCEQYWPTTVHKATMIDSLRLTMTEEQYHTVYVYRLIIVYNKTKKQERKVHHFHFTEWPDHGVPDSVKLVKFYRKVKSEKCDEIGPMVVHCSAGVGRTGTFIAVDALYENSRKVGFIDLFEYVQMMRKDRINMIQTHEQYEVVFEALLELLTVPDTSIQKNDFCGHIQMQDNKTLPKNRTMYSEEFQRLRTLKPSYSADNFSAASNKENKSKNSAMAILAHDNYRPYLMSYGKTRSDYINAVIIPGYAIDSKVVVTQCPLVDTVIDFWTMIYDHGSRIIVLLDPGNTDAPLWLEKKEMLQFDDFRIIKETENAQEELQLTLHHTKNKEKLFLNVFTANEWHITNALPSPEYMLDLLQRVQICWETQKVPITVVCSDGCSKSGLFVALKLILEKMQIDEEVDIFQEVRELQTRRPEFLVEFDQYEFCYKCVRVLLEGDPSDSLYANI